VRLREDVLAIVSHDLRNPLGAIQIGASMLARRIPDADSRVLQVIERIRRSATRMDRLIDDLLALGSIERGALTLNVRPTQLGPVLLEILHNHTPQAATKAIEVRHELDLGDLEVPCDPDRLLQVLSNLLANAIKFSRAGDLITLRAFRRDDEIVVSVADTGPGIPDEQLTHAFQPYWSAGNVPPSSVGLGLYISREIIEAHGGRIGIETHPDEGSVVTFTLPMVAPPATSPDESTS
jgi:signal transduction histidine kinase